MRAILLLFCATSASIIAAPMNAMGEIVTFPKHDDSRMPSSKQVREIPLRFLLPQSNSLLFCPFHSEEYHRRIAHHPSLARLDYYPEQSETEMEYVEKKRVLAEALVNIRQQGNPNTTQLGAMTRFLHKHLEEYHKVSPRTLEAVKAAWRTFNNTKTKTNASQRELKLPKEEKEALRAEKNHKWNTNYRKQKERKKKGDYPDFERLMHQFHIDPEEHSALELEIATRVFRDKYDRFGRGATLALEQYLSGEQEDGTRRYTDAQVQAAMMQRSEALATAREQRQSTRRNKGQYPYNQLERDMSAPTGFFLSDLHPSSSTSGSESWHGGDESYQDYNLPAQPQVLPSMSSYSTNAQFQPTDRETFSYTGSSARPSSFGEPNPSDFTSSQPLPYEEHGGTSNYAWTLAPHHSLMTPYPTYSSHLVHPSGRPIQRVPPFQEQQYVPDIGQSSSKSSAVGSILSNDPPYWPSYPVYSGYGSSSTQGIEHHTITPASQPSYNHGIYPGQLALNLSRAQYTWQP